VAITEATVAREAKEEKVARVATTVDLPVDTTVV